MGKRRERTHVREYQWGAVWGGAECFRDRIRAAHRDLLIPPKQEKEVKLKLEIELDYR